MKKHKVAFRKFEEGDVIALFTDFQRENWIGSYMHVGQHSNASPDLLTELEAATPEEYKELAEELTSIGYNLEIQ